MQCCTQWDNETVYISLGHLGFCFYSLLFMFIAHIFCYQRKNKTLADSNYKASVLHRNYQETEVKADLRQKGKGNPIAAEEKGRTQMDVQTKSSKRGVNNGTFSHPRCKIFKNLRIDVR